MPATRIRRHRSFGLLAVLGLSVALLAGCSGQKDPGSYTGQVKRSFTASCTTTTVLAANPKIKVGDTDSLVSKSEAATKGTSKAVMRTARDYCVCVYAKITKKVRFGTFKKVNENLRESGGELPKSFTKAYAACKVSEQSLTA